MARSSHVWCLVVLSLLVVAAASSAHRTTTMVEIVSNNDQAGRRCKQEIQQQQLSSCRQYLREGHRFAAESAANDSGWREHFPQCCDQLERISEQCRCQAIKQVAQSRQVQGELEGMQKQEMLRTAESLPGLCRIAPRYCQNIQGEEADSVF